MKIFRITVINAEVGDDEKAFQERLGKKLNRAGFNTGDPIIRQPRSDVDAMDFIQFRYTWLDRFEIELMYTVWGMRKWFIKQFAKPKKKVKIKKKKTLNKRSFK